MCETLLHIFRIYRRYYCKRKFKKMVCIEIEENEWEQYFMIPYTVRNNTKFINF